jgi:hypothetical protein
MYNRAFLENNGLRFVSERQYLSEDMLFNVMSLLKCSAAIVLPNVFYNYFVNNNSITTTVRPDYIKYLDRTIERLKSLADDVEDFEMRKSMLLRIDRYIIGETRSYMKHIFRSTLKRCDKVALLDDMLRRKYMKEVVRIYPRRKMPMMHRIVFELFIHRCYSVLGVLFKAKL